MKVAAYQAPLLASDVPQSIALIREQVDACEQNGVSILCCPEGILGGLADYAAHPCAFAIDTDNGTLERVLAPLASDTVTCIAGFTEIDRHRNLFNTVALFHRGTVLGCYRKLHPAINRSVYSAGTETPVFTVGSLTLGILICRDSVFAEPARIMTDKGATALFIPTNCGLPANRFGPEVATEARDCDIARATENAVYTIRADMAGESGALKSYGSSAIVAPDGTVLASVGQLSSGLIVADIPTSRLVRVSAHIAHD